MSQWFRIVAPGEIAPGGRKIVCVARRRVLLLRLEDGWSAVESVCPHQQFPLDEGQLADSVLTCPQHHFRYDVRTGANLYPANVYPRDLDYLQAQLAPLTFFRVEERPDGVWVEMPANGGTRGGQA